MIKEERPTKAEATYLKHLEGQTQVQMHELIIIEMQRLDDDFDMNKLMESVMGLFKKNLINLIVFQDVSIHA